MSPHRGLFDTSADPQREQRRQNADEEHRAPAVARQDQGDDDGGEAAAAMRALRAAGEASCQKVNILNLILYEANISE